MPDAPSALNLDGLGLSAGRPSDAALRVDRDEWAAEVPEIRAFFDRFGDRLPGSWTGPSTRWPASRRHRDGLTRDRGAARHLGILLALMAAPRPVLGEIVVVVSANAEWKALARDRRPTRRATRRPTANGSPDGVKAGGRDVPVVFFHGGWGKISAAGSTSTRIDRWKPRAPREPGHVRRLPRGDPEGRMSSPSTAPWCTTSSS